MIRLAALLLLAGLPGCRFDDDDAYRIRTRTSLLLVRDSAGMLGLWRLADGAADSAWERTLGLETGALRGADAAAGRCWLADGPGGRMLEADLAAETVLRTYPMRNPGLVCAGERYLLCADTSQARLIWYRMGRSDSTGRAAPAKPRIIRYHAGKFFVAFHDGQLGVYHEQALAPLYIDTLESPALDLQWDGVHYLVARIDRGSRRFEARMSYSTNRLEPQLQEISASKIRYTPFRRTEYGAEWLTAVRLQNGQLDVPGAPAADDFEADFREGVLWIQRTDTLFRHEIRPGAATPAGLLRGRMLQSWHDAGPES